MKARIAAALLALATATVLVGGCATDTDPTATYPQPSIGPGRTVSPGVGPTRAAIVQALGDQRITMRDVQAPVRPPESALLAAAPRTVYQAILPDDPDGGYIVVYEFRDPEAASTAAAEQQRYLESGPALVQVPGGTVHVLRSLGSTVILYDWLPGAARDDQAPGVQAALETVGTAYPVGG